MHRTNRLERITHANGQYIVLEIAGTDVFIFSTKRYVLCEAVFGAGAEQHRSVSAICANIIAFCSDLPVLCGDTNFSKQREAIS